MAVCRYNKMQIEICYCSYEKMNPWHLFIIVGGNFISVFCKPGYHIVVKFVDNRNGFIFWFIYHAKGAECIRIVEGDRNASLHIYTVDGRNQCDTQFSGNESGYSRILIGLIGNARRESGLGKKVQGFIVE